LDAEKFRVIFETRADIQKENSKFVGKEEPKLSLIQKAKLRIFGIAKIGEVRRGPRKGTEIFLGRCAIHGLYADTMHLAMSASLPGPL
jgi:hypothetical protein